MTSTPDGGREARAAYREEDGRLLLTNPLLTASLSARHGALLSLVHLETDLDFIDSREADESGYLWRLELQSPDGQSLLLTSRDCAEFTYTTGRHRHEGAVALWLQWRGFPTDSEPLEAALTAEITFPKDTPEVGFAAEVELPDGWSVRSFDFPCVCSVECGDPLLDDGLFLPLSGGVFIPSPRSLARAGDSQTWQAAYPAPASLQLIGYCCGDRASLWLAARDSHGARKTLAASPMSSSSRLKLSLTQHPVRRPDGRWSTTYPAAVGLSLGDWFEAARDYRDWAATQPWTSRGRIGERSLPAPTSAYGLWTSHCGTPARTVAAARELLRHVNAPIKLDWRCWHQCARSGAYPDYLPPRGGDQAFAQAEAQLGDAGVLDQLDLDALLVSPESTAWKERGAEAYTLRPAPGDEPVTPPAVSGLPPPAVMCPGTDYWQGVLAAIAREAASRGADGLLLEHLGSASTCLEAGHDHGPPHPSQWTASLRSLLTSLRSAIGAGRQLAIDAPSETLLDLADASFSPHAALEREGLLPDTFGRGWTPIPLFAAVYHDYTTLVGPDLSLVSQRFSDPLWPGAVTNALREPAPIMQRDYQLQFCLEVARAMTWGYQLFLENFSPEQSRDDANRRKLAFLAAALRAQAWGIGALLPQSQFLGPLAIDGPTLDIDLLVNPPKAAPADRRTLRRRLPAVYGSAWRLPGGGLALVLANIDTDEAPFTARLRSSRLRPQLPLRLVGRTFSEDGDVPAASLRASGTDITGRLPSRAIVLISLR